MPFSLRMFGAFIVVFPPDSPIFLSLWGQDVRVTAQCVEWAHVAQRQYGILRVKSVETRQDVQLHYDNKNIFLVYLKLVDSFSFWSK